MKRQSLNIRIFICKVIFNPVFIIKVDHGIVSKVSGTVNSSFVYDCDDVFKRNDIKFAFVYAEKSSYGKPVLKCSGNIPNYALQQLRNIYSFHS